MNRPSHPPFGDVLKELRQRKRLSRQQVAEQLGNKRSKTGKHSTSALEKWEQGVVLPDRSRLEDLIEALELTDAEELLLREAHAGHRILPSLHNVPASHSFYFTGREDVLAQLHTQFTRERHVALTQSPQAVSGLGGIGKTQVALYYISRFQKAYSHILWVAADSQERVTTEFIKLAHDLHLPEKDERDQRKIVQAMQRWLREYVDWLLILDNVEDISLVNTFVPAGHLGSVLITTRRQVTEPIAQTIVLNVFAEDEGALFLLKRAKRLEPHGLLDQAKAAELATARLINQQLGGLPLALDQAGAYIIENGYNLSDYLHLFQHKQTALLEQRGTNVTDHPLSVSTTFALAFEQVQQKSEVASEILKLCAFLAPNAIPIEIFMQRDNHLGPILEPTASDELLLNQVLKTLQDYSLIQRNGEDRTFSIHRLVQVVIQDTLEKEEYCQCAERLVLSVNALFPRDPQNVDTWPQCLRYLEQAQACDTLIQQHRLVLTEAADLLNRTGRYIYERGLYTLAEPLFHRAQDIWEKQLGSEHLDVASVLTNLALLYKEQSKYPESELLFSRALQIRKLHLGSDHPDVAYVLNGLAELHREQGKYSEAELLYQRALQIREQSRGPDHPDVASSLNNLAILYSHQGKYVEAEPLYQRVLAIREQSLGPNHPRVASPLNNLAELYRGLGKYSEAELLYHRALAIWEQSRGLDHPDVTYPLNGLAELYRELGKYVEAEPLYQRALAIREQSLGHNHPRVANPLNGLAELYRELGKYSEAELLYQRALQIREQQLGPEHLEVAYVLNGLAELYLKQGNYEQTDILYRRALRIREQQLGHNHPDVVSVLNGLANLHLKQGSYEQADLLFQQVLSLRERILELRQPDIAETLHGIATLRVIQDNLREAVIHYQRALAIREHIFGSQHPKSCETRESLRDILTRVDNRMEGGNTP